MEQQNFELNKQAFGAFLAQLRREKGWTQKDLAEKLYVSDKAVSKWERGLSVPDVSLLLPLAELLGISVTELLEGRRLEEQQLPANEVEALVKKALTIPKEPVEVRRGRVKNTCRCIWSATCWARWKRWLSGIWGGCLKKWERCCGSAAFSGSFSEHTIFLQRKFFQATMMKTASITLRRVRSG